MFLHRPEIVVGPLAGCSGKLWQPATNTLPPSVPPLRSATPSNQKGLGDTLVLDHRSPKSIVQDVLPVVPQEEDPRGRATRSPPPPLCRSESRADFHFIGLRILRCQPCPERKVPSDPCTGIVCAGPRLRSSSRSTWRSRSSKPQEWRSPRSTSWRPPWWTPECGSNPRPACHSSGHTSSTPGPPPSRLPVS
jgi:hypothetical protein